METASILNIKSIKDQIKEKIKQADKSEFSNQKFGNEGEYTYKSLLLNLDMILSDISYLTKAHKKFIYISSASERQAISNSLDNINRYFNSPQNLVQHLENLKVHIQRFLWIKNYSDERKIFDQEVEEVKAIKLEVQQILNDINKKYEDVEDKSNRVKDNLNDFETNLVNVHELKNDLVRKIDEFENNLNQIITFKEQSQNNVEVLENILVSSKSNKKLIDNFSDKIIESENHVELLKNKSLDNIEKLEEYKTERQVILEEAKELIESAKEALNYKTAEGISASFQEQYQAANNKWLFRSWMCGAFICILLTIGLGVWITLSVTDSYILLIARISILPLPIIGTIFCANQYVRQKNIAEDYAYKMVLSKAIVGFSEQLKKHGSENNEEYVQYIKVALQEIHKDPLRKRAEVQKVSNSKNNVEQVVDLAERIVKITRSE